MTPAETSWRPFSAEVLRRADMLLIGREGVPDPELPSLLRHVCGRASVLLDSSRMDHAPASVEERVRVFDDLAGMLLTEGHTAVDYEDVRAILGLDGRTSVVSVVGSGEMRIDEAVAAAAHRQRSLWQRASGLLVSVAFGPGRARLLESKSALNLIRDFAPMTAHVIYGTSRDSRLQAGQVG